jgi:hypothetical protein
MKQKDGITMLDPDMRRSEQMRTFEENRQRMEKQGVYRAPNFMLRGTVSFVIIVLLILLAMFVFHVL